MRSKLLYVYVGLIGLLAGCGCNRSAERVIEREARSARIEADICFSLAQFIFQNNVSAGQQNVDYYFLRIGGADPTPDFLARFAGHKPTVLPVSLAHVDALAGVQHKETRGRGLVFWIHEIEWVSDSEVSVGWGYYESGLSSSVNAATLKRDDQEWVVTDDEIILISSRLTQRATV
jgi:hypothetical protein